jgi:hypothetical protein
MAEHAMVRILDAVEDVEHMIAQAREPWLEDRRYVRELP